MAYKVFQKIKATVLPNSESSLPLQQQSILYKSHQAKGLLFCIGATCQPTKRLSFVHPAQFAYTITSYSIFSMPLTQRIMAKWPRKGVL